MRKLCPLRAGKNIDLIWTGFGLGLGQTQTAHNSTDPLYKLRLILIQAKSHSSCSSTNSSIFLHWSNRIRQQATIWYATHSTSWRGVFLWRTPSKRPIWFLLWQYRCWMQPMCSSAVSTFHSAACFSLTSTVVGICLLTAESSYMFNCVLESILPLFVINSDGISCVLFRLTCHLCLVDVILWAHFKHTAHRHWEWSLEAKGDHCISTQSHYCAVV